MLAPTVLGVVGVTCTVESIRHMLPYAEGPGIYLWIALGVVVCEIVFAPRWWVNAELVNSDLEEYAHMYGSDHVSRLPPEVLTWGGWVEREEK